MGRSARKGKSADTIGEITVRPAAALARITPLARLAALLVVMMPAAASAQSATGDIQGVVTEQAAGPLAGVSISVTHTDTSAFRVVTSGPDGRFAIPGLPAGVYDVLAMLDGFAAQRQERVAVRVGQTVVSNLELRRAVLPETLTLADAPSSLDARHSDVTFRLEPVELDALPRARRDALDLLGLVPGAVTPPRSAGLSAGGIGSAYTTVVVDGLAESGLGTQPAARASTGERRAGWSRLAVQEAHAVLSGAVAEHSGGGASGQLVSRSGSQLSSGRLFEEWRGGALTAATARGEELDLSVHQFGGSFGGPLSPGHVFFAAYEGLRSRQEQETFLHVPPASGLPPAVRDALQPLASPWIARTDQDLLHVRTDHRVGAAARVTVRYRQADAAGSELDPAGPRLAQDAAVPFDLRSRGLAGVVAGRVGPLAFNELRVGYTHDSVDAGAAAALPQADVYANGTLALRTGGHAQESRRRLRSLQLGDTAMWSTFRHALRAGGSIEWFTREYDVAAGARGAYLFDAHAPLGSGPFGAVRRYSQTFFAGSADSLRIRPDSRHLALFVQDKWLVHDTFSVDAGLRLERDAWESPGITNPDPQLLNAGIDTGAFDAGGNRWSPRLGVAWTPSSRYVVRGAYAIASARIPETLVSPAYVYNGVSARTIALGSDAVTALPSWPERLGSAPPEARPSIVFFDRDFASPRVRHASAGLEWAWMPRTSVSVTFLHSRGTQLPRAVELNVGAATPASFTTDEGTLTASRFAPGPFSNFDRVVQYESTAESRYSGVAFELRRQWGQGVAYRLAYTLGKATDTGAIDSGVALTTRDGARTIPTPVAAGADRAPSDHDRRHRFLATAIARSDAISGLLGGFVEPVLDDWLAAIVYTLEDGRPYSAMVSGDLNGDSNVWNDLAPGARRNEHRLPRTGRIDVRLSRGFSVGAVQLTGNLDVFNMLNSANYRLPDDTLYSVDGALLVRNPLFGERLDQLMPRTMQVGVTVGF